MSVSVCIVSGLGKYVLRVELHQLACKALQRPSTGLEIVYSGVEATCKGIDSLVAGCAFRRFGNMPVSLAFGLCRLAGDSYAFPQSAVNAMGKGGLTGAAVGGVALQGAAVGFRSINGHNRGDEGQGVVDDGDKDDDDDNCGHCVVSFFCGVGLG